MKLRYNGFLFNSLPFQHVVMHPLPKVLHIHFKREDDVGRVMWRLDEQLKAMSVEEGDQDTIGKRHGLFKISWRGICYYGGRFIVDEVLPKMQPLMPCEDITLYREMKKMDGDFALVVTYGQYGCAHWLTRHELAHAIWHQFPTYQERVQRVLAKLSPPLRHAIQIELGALGYINPKIPLIEQAEHIANETQARIYSNYRFTCYNYEKGSVELGYHRAKMYEIMEDYYPHLNHIRMLMISRWRNLHCDKQIAYYRKWIEQTDTSMDGEEWGGGRIHIQKEEMAIA